MIYTLVLVPCIPHYCCTTATLSILSMLMMSSYFKISDSPENRVHQYLWPVITNRKRKSVSIEAHNYKIRMRAPQYQYPRERYRRPVAYYPVPGVCEPMTVIPGTFPRYLHPNTRRKNNRRVYVRVRVREMQNKEKMY